METTNYTVIASCNAYNANFHNVGGTPIKAENGTVVEWTFSNWTSLSLDQARKLLAEMASEESGDVHYEDDDSIADMRKQAAGEDIELDWYVGPGYYSAEDRFYNPTTDGGYSYDVMTYRIEEQADVEVASEESDDVHYEDDDSIADMGEQAASVMTCRVEEQADND